jgi:hypothetical protein
MAKSLTTSYTSKVDGYQQTLKKLKKDFLGEAATVTEITVHQILAKANEISLKIDDTSTRTSSYIIHTSAFSLGSDNLLRLGDMNYARGPYKPNPCHVGTRENVIHNIIKWFSRPLDDDVPRVYWLSGVAGCGKSAIARSVTDRLGAQKRCVSFFFNVSNQSNAGPDRLFATLSRDLARFNESWEACLIKILESVTTDSSTVEEQFENFMLRPAGMLDNIGPILIVIDALDESGTVQQRERLLRILKRLHELPLHLRFLITSRPESDIVPILDNDARVYRYQLHDSDVLLTNRDIGRYVKWSLGDITRLDKAHLDGWAQEIVARSEGLFQWAATACRYIKGNGAIGHNPREKLAEVLSTSAFDGLDSLYTAILDRLSTFERDDIIGQRFQSIMGRVLSLREPLPIDVLSKLWYDDEDKGQVEMILEPLGSLLSGVWQTDEPVRPIHVSFIDFLRNESRSGKYWIDITREHGKLTKSLLREMQLLLRFNICNLNTSYKQNSKVENLDARVTENIPVHLSYACRYWVKHLIQTPVTHEWADRVDRFMRSYLLFWFEALSLKGGFGPALDQLIKLQNWLVSLASTVFPI